MKRAVYAIPAVGLLWTGCGSVKVDAECGNGIVEGDETCDDANAVETDDCPSTCETARCNDGFIQFGVEDCDDGNDSDSDACTNSCDNARCGDALTFDQAGGTEQCDDANDSDNDGCTTDCQLDPVLRAFEMTIHRNIQANDIISYRVCTAPDPYGGCYGPFATCSLDFTSPLTMSIALLATGSYSRTRNCDINNFDTVVTRMLSGTVEVLTTRLKYRISLMEDTTAVVLTCDMDAARNLSCKDAGNATWAFVPK